MPFTPSSPSSPLAHFDGWGRRLHCPPPKASLKGRGATTRTPQAHLPLWPFNPRRASLTSLPLPPLERDSSTRQRAEALQRSLADYRIEAKVVSFRRGARLELFLLELPKGFKSKKLLSLASDLARSLAAPALRVLERVPGTSHVGIEMARPREAWEVLTLKEGLKKGLPDSAQSYKLPLCLGENPWGAPFWVDLLEVPHLLVAGATGSGKSNWIRSLLAQIWLRTSPEKLQWILMDFKRVELAAFAQAPHLRMPLIVDLHQAAEALERIIQEMEQRFSILQQAALEGLRPPLPFPHWLVVMDEFSDLMLLSPALERQVIRLAQQGRAAGIHLILATQRPSKEVVTGLLKANFLYRIAFKVQAQVDSRVILDGPGAERLLGEGDLLYLSSQGEALRLHALQTCPSTLAEVIEAAPPWAPLPQWPLSPRTHGMALRPSSAPRSELALLKQALNLLRESRQLSITQLQRHSRVGYNRAARMIDYLQEQGVLGPSERGGPRPLQPPYDRLEGSLEGWLEALAPSLLSQPHPLGQP